MRIIKIDDCMKCPYLYNDMQYGFWMESCWKCSMGKKKFGSTIDDVPKEIPTWCPLEEIDVT